MRRASTLLFLALLIGCGGGEAEPGPASVPAVAVDPAPSTAAPTVVPVVPGSPTVARGTPLSIRGGTTFACALREGGRVACWGRNTEGQLGQDHRDSVEGAVHVRGLEDAISLAAVSGAACALRRSGRVVCWGSNTSGALGIDGERRGTVEVPSLRDMRGLDADGGRFYAWGADGVVYAWGLPDSQVDEEAIVGPRRTRLRDVRRIEGGSARYALHSDGHATVWGWGRSGLAREEDVFDVAGGAGGACLRDSAGVVRCALETATGHEDRVAESLEGAEMLVFPRGGLVVGLREGRLQVFSYYEGATTRFEGADGLAALGRGLGARVMAITRDGRVRVWEEAARDGAFHPTDIPLPAPGEDAPEPSLAEGPMPRYCTIEVERIAAPAPIALARAIMEALHEDSTAADLEPGELCASMRVAFGSSDCPEDGPWLGIGSIEGIVSVVQPLPDGRARLLSRVASDWSGTEEFDVLEVWTLRSATPLALAMITSRGEPTDDVGLGMNPGEVARAAVVILETPEGDFIEVRANVDIERAGRAHVRVNRLPSARLVDGRVELWACDGHGTYAIPATASHAFDARPEDSAVIMLAPPPTTDGPSPDAITAAREQCNEGFRALNRGELDVARTEIDAALAILNRATDAAAVRTYGACLYNRGRLAELEGDPAAARTSYERSLAARPNPTVEERLRSLTP